MAERALPAPIDWQRDPAIADFYDELPLWSAPFALLLLERVPLARGMTIVDVGAGTGFLAIDLAQRCGATTTVYAVDPWAAACARLRRKLDYLGISNVTVLEQDAAALDLPAGSVDLVVSNLGVNNFANAGAVLAACRRALRAGGRLMLTTNLVGHMQELYDEYALALEDLGLGAHRGALDAHVAHRATVERTRALLEGAGFTVRDVTQSSFRIRFADGTAVFEHWFMRLGFVPSWIDVVPAADAPRAIGRLIERLDARAAREGGLALTVPMALVEAEAG